MGGTFIMGSSIFQRSTILFTKNVFLCRDVMEPITYLSGLSTVILGYLW